MADRAELSPEVIVEAALRVLDRVGLSGLSMRAVARELERAPMSLYRHVDNKAALLELLRARVLDGERPPAMATDRGWRAAIEQRLLAVRAQLQRHPGAVWLFESPAFLRPGPMGAVDEVLAVLRGAGLGAAEAAEVSAALWAHLVGAVLAAQAPAAAWPGEELAPAARLAWAAALADPALGASPRLAAAALRWVGLDHDTVYRTALRAMLDGVAARLEGGQSPGAQRKTVETP